jgi:hypothetical protein
MWFILPLGWDGNVEGWGSVVGLDGRQQHQSPETEVGVAGHRAGRAEPEDQGRSQELNVENSAECGCPAR